MTKNYARPIAVATLTLTLALGGCQTMSDLDPTGLLGSDDEVAETQFPPESEQQAAADAATTTPDLAAIPARPPAPNTAAQADAAQQVASAGAQAQYSAEALRAGTDAAAPPPTAADASVTRQNLAAADAPPTAQADAPPTAGADAPPTAGDAPPSAAAAAPVAAPARAASGDAAVPPAPQRVASAAPPPAATPAPSAAPVTAPVARAPIAASPGAEPAVPAVPATAGGRMAMANPSDAQLGFKPSSAPALNPGVANWVAPPIMARYRQTAALAGTAGTGAPAVPAVAPKGMGGPMMSGNVVANLDAIPGTAAGMIAANNGGIPPAAVIYFAGDGTSLTSAGLAEVRQAAAAFKATGGTGTVKVVGHASSRTPNMPVERHLEVIFQKSQARANAVAQALIKAGVPAAQVHIEAVGDSQPVYYESMPKGEAGNRRAEIFLQG